MFFATIDCGTTNSRVYILNDRYEIVNRGSKKVGVRDTAVTGSNQVLKEGLNELFLHTVEESGLEVQQIEFAVTSGMITSEIGLIEIPHLWAPAGIDELTGGIKVVNDPELFSVDLPLIFIRGVKNRYTPDTNYKEIRGIDFMRGEETQAAGLMSHYQELSYPLIFVVMGSHTKYIHINQEKKISGSITTISGQTYEAIKKHTFIGKSIASDNDEPFYDREVIDTAYDSVANAGFLRTLLMPRFMEVLLGTDSRVRELFINSAIIADDLKALNDSQFMGFSKNCNYFLTGQRIRCQIMKYLLQKHYCIEGEIRYISAEEEIDQLSIQGAIAIASNAGYLS